MSLFGALSSGVSGLTAQSSAMGAISDNITNVSTVGYKNTRVDFQTLVTKQTSSTFYSAGGVQSTPRQDTGVQGLLQASTSSTDIAISGQGYFVVNEAAVPGINNQYLYSRAGSFFQDNEGYLRNTSGYYLQGWPTDAAGVVTPANDSLVVSNQNIVSTDYLETINLNRVGGTATATSTIAIGANLPANDLEGVTHKTDVQYFDSLGNANTMSFVYTKGMRENTWDLTVDPPLGAGAVSLEDSTLPTAKVFKSTGQLEFNISNALGDATRRPADGATVIIDGITYEFDTKAFAATTASAANTFVVSATNLVTATAGTFSGLVVGDSVTMTTSEDGGNDAAHVITAVAADGSSITMAGSVLTNNAADTAMTVTYFNGGAGESATRVRVDKSTTTTLTQDVAALVNRVVAHDNDFDTTNNRISVSSGNTTTILFRDDGGKAIVVDPTGLLDASGVSVVKQTTSLTAKKPDADYSGTTQFVFAADAANNDTVIINGITYTFLTAEAADSTGADTNINRGVSIAATLADLEAAIEANDANFSVGGSRVSLRNWGGTSAAATANNTLVLTTLKSASYDVIFSAGFAGSTGATAATSFVRSPDDLVFYADAAATTTAVNTKQAINFTSDGLPNEINVSKIEVLNYASGAYNMDSTRKMTIDFGNLLEANGMTQFGAAFSPTFITQNGSRFGTFAGVTVANDGQVTALFDNGETRKIYKIPIATFVNVNQLEGNSGNVWNASEKSGDYTLREADNGPAGQVVQGALEASTVDIGEEFTKMIVVQRAYSASAKIISTADEMLAELMRVKG